MKNKIVKSKKTKSFLKDLFNNNNYPTSLFRNPVCFIDMWGNLNTIKREGIKYPDFYIGDLVCVDDGDIFNITVCKNNIFDAKNMILLERGFSGRSTINPIIIEEVVGQSIEVNNMSINDLVSKLIEAEVRGATKIRLNQTDDSYPEIEFYFEREQTLDEANSDITYYLKREFHPPTLKVHRKQRVQA